MWKLLAKDPKTMERIPKHSLGLLTILLFIIGTTCVESATVSAGDDQIGLIGNNTVNIVCSFTLSNGESANGMRVQRRRLSGNWNDVATFNIPANSSLYGDISLRERTDLTLTQDSTMVGFRIVECNDAATYKCVFESVFNQVTSSFEDSMILSVQANPEGKPSFTAGNPNSRVFVEYEEMSITCDADVGLPAGNLVWYGYKDGQNPVDLTSSATQGQPTQGNSGPRYCAFSRQSVLTVNLTRDYDKYIFRCAVNQSTLVPPTPSSSCVDTPCFQSQRIEVQYPVRQQDLIISSFPTDGTVTVGNDATLTCTVTGNPEPTFRWMKNDGNRTFEGGKQWELRDLTLEDAGTYTCIGSNTVGGVMYNVTASVNINVVETTTPAPTSSTASASTQNPGGSTDAVKPPPAEGGTTTIIIAVCVVIGVLLIVAIIAACIIIRKRKKQSEVEEPPEKPFNKNNLSMYNTKPDLVTDEKKQNYNYKNDDGLTYADLRFDDKPRSRRPVAYADNMTDYADITIPQV